MTLILTLACLIAFQTSLTGASVRAGTVLSVQAGRSQLSIDAGAAGLAKAIQRLGVVASVLHTGAHPDDEDSSLLSYLARGRQARTAYLSLTRGDGGQNLIGPELYESLGIIRTEELLAARRLDGAGQFFTRAYDFGFSKSRAEALSKWDRNEILSDMVRVIRTFRPMVIVSCWSGTPNDGHGQHQFAGLLTVEAYRAAADPKKFPAQINEGLKPWQAKKLYVRAADFGQPGDQQFIRLTSLSINTGEYDAVLGRGYSEIATEGRNQHRTQDQDSIIRRGPRYSRLRLIENEVGPIEPEKDIFESLDTSITGVAKIAGQPESGLSSILSAAQQAAEEARTKFNPFIPSEVIPIIARGMNKIREARAIVSSRLQAAPADSGLYEADFLLKQKEADFADALGKAAGVVVDCLSDDEVVIPGQEFTVTVETYADQTGVPPAVTLIVPEGWKAAQKKRTNSNLDSRKISVTEFAVTVSRDAEPSEAYWLKNPRNGDMFSPGRGGTGIEPLSPPPVAARVEYDIAGEKVTVTQPAQFRYAAKAQGELRHELKVAPAISVNVSPEVIVFPASATATRREVTVTLENNLKGGARGTVGLDGAADWKVTPAEAAFDLKREGERASFTFTVTTPPGASESRRAITAVASADGQQFRRGYELISYHHIEPRLAFHPSQSEAQVIDAKLAPRLKVGYIEGAGDDFANALKLLGADVELIEPNLLASGDLSRFDTIVLGVRVYEVRPDVLANNSRLLEYVRNGGTLIVQYNKTNYEEGNYAPYPTSRRRSQGADPQARALNREPRLIYLDEKTISRALSRRSEPGYRVGFIGSREDQFLKASASSQIAMKLIEENEVATGDLSQFDLIVVGASAQAARPDLAANNQRLIDYARRRPLIVAYSQEQFLSSGFAEYPRPDSRPYRVTDEQAAVTILDPSSPVFNYPNRITARDFEGWITERGAYFLSDWDPNFKPLLAANDAGEQPRQGGQLIASYGKGFYIYTAYAWFRQLPKGVPGAYRLIANLVSLPKAPRNQATR
jgi:LmbE family N-acetylglucosaminyl deacetylase